MADPSKAAKPESCIIPRKQFDNGYHETEQYKGE